MVSPLHCGPLALTGAPPARLTLSRLTMCEWVGWLDCPIRAPQCKNTTLHCTTPGMHFWLVGHHLSFGPGVSEWVGWNASGFQPRSGRLVPPHTPHTTHNPFFKYDAKMYDSFRSVFLKFRCFDFTFLSICHLDTFAL